DKETGRIGPLKLRSGASRWAKYSARCAAQPLSSSAKTIAIPRRISRPPFTANPTASSLLPAAQRRSRLIAGLAFTLARHSRLWASGNDCAVDLTLANLTSRALSWGGRKGVMRRLMIILRLAGATSLAEAGLPPLLAAPAFADCQVISATHGGNWQGEALSMSQALAARSARELKAQKGWRAITMKAQKVKPDPFWKTVRPEVSSNIIVGSYV